MRRLGVGDALVNSRVIERMLVAMVSPTRGSTSREVCIGAFDSVLDSLCRRAAASNLRMALHKHVSAMRRGHSLRLMKTDIGKRKTTQTSTQTRLRSWTMRCGARRQHLAEKRPGCALEGRGGAGSVPEEGQIWWAVGPLWATTHKWSHGAGASHNQP